MTTQEQQIRLDLEDENLSVKEVNDKDWYYQIIASLKVKSYHVPSPYRINAFNAWENDIFLILSIQKTELL